MRSNLILILLILILPVFEAVAAGRLETYSLKHDGLKRKYVVYVPSTYDSNQPTPVILNFHGGGGYPKVAWDMSFMNEKADTAGFLAVYPAGTGKRFFTRVFGTWNAGRCCAYAKDKNIDDVGFVSQLIDDLKTKYNIDEKRVFATGLSNGAMISYRLACDLSDKIAAIAPVSGHDTLDRCETKRPVSVLHFHGTADPTAFYQGGHCGSFLMKKTGGWACRAVPEYLEEWRMRNACPKESKISYKNGQATCLTYGPCKDQTEVTLCTIEGGGHTWPGGAYGDMSSLIKKRIGPISKDISATDMMWEFFLKHPIP